MNKLFSDFPKVSKERWEEVLVKELKGADFSSLLRNDEIEEINYATFSHESDALKNNEIPGNSSFSRGTKIKSNDWTISKQIKVSDEKLANNFALNQLLTGNTGLVFDLSKEQLDLNILFNEIGFEHIEVQFIIRHISQIELLKNYFQSIENKNILYRIDFLENFTFSELVNLSKLLKNQNCPFCLVNTFEIEQTGATIIQQLAFALATGHEYLIQLINNGYSVSEAEKSIHFLFGFGNNYFYELSKIRAFRKLWLKIVQNYDTNAIITCHITGEIGFTNKSLKDPYTNLLRQTTEAMSAVSSGINTLIVHPYNSFSKEGETVISNRMATNISLILKDESYFDKVIDPIGGSYAIENLTEQIAQKSWIYFQELDELGGILSASMQIKFKNDVSEKADLKIQKIQTGKRILIGVNKFPNPQSEAAEWKEKTNYFGIDQLIFERDIKMN